VERNSGFFEHGQSGTGRAKGIEWPDVGTSSTSIKRYRQPARLLCPLMAGNLANRKTSASSRVFWQAYYQKLDTFRGGLSFLPLIAPPDLNRVLTVLT
jgi:hypothetical protein